MAADQIAASCAAFNTQINKLARMYRAKTAPGTAAEQDAALLQSRAGLISRECPTTFIEHIGPHLFTYGRQINEGKWAELLTHDFAAETKLLTGAAAAQPEHIANIMANVKRTYESSTAPEKKMIEGAIFAMLVAYCEFALAAKHMP